MVPPTEITCPPSSTQSGTLAVRLRMGEEGMVAAREDLLTHDLIAFRPPLTQVLSLPRARLQRRGLHGLETLLRATEDSQREGGYSVPPQTARKTLLLRASDTLVRLLEQGQEVARHARCYDRGQLICEPTHPLEPLKLRQRVRANQVEEAFDALGENQRIALQPSCCSSAPPSIGPTRRGPTVDDARAGAFREPGSPFTRSHVCRKLGAPVCSFFPAAILRREQDAGKMIPGDDRRIGAPTGKPPVPNHHRGHRTVVARIQVRSEQDHPVLNRLAVQHDGTTDRWTVAAATTAVKKQRRCQKKKRGPVFSG